MMFFIIFYKGKACAMTVWTKHALDRIAGDGWEVEAHDDWPEARSHEDLLRETVSESAPDSVGGISVDHFWERYVLDRIEPLEATGKE